MCARPTANFPAPTWDGGEASATEPREDVMRFRRTLYLLQLTLLACDEHPLPLAPSVPTNALEGSRPAPLLTSTLREAMKRGPTIEEFQNGLPPKPTYRKAVTV